jgi:predicted HD superfamily hydrolase involved in NAD metabolism
MLTEKIHEGIPTELTLERAQEWIRPRISDKRFQHVKGVAKVAHELAEDAGCDIFLAELAGWLHDGCKENKDRDLVIQAMQYGLQLSAIDRVNASLLHGPVAAEKIKAELGVTNSLVLDAIREHTLGAVTMTELSKVVFLADCLEASRPSDYTDPIWEALRGSSNTAEKKSKKKHGLLDLDAAILTACDLGLRQLLDSGRVIHPKTVDVRNHFLAILRERTKSE